MVVERDVLSLLLACFGMVYLGKVGMGSFVLRKGWKSVGKYWVAHLIFELAAAFFLVRVLFFSSESYMGNAVSVALFGSLWAISVVLMLKAVHVLSAAREKKSEK